MKNNSRKGRERERDVSRYFTLHPWYFCLVYEYPIHKAIPIRYCFRRFPTNNFGLAAINSPPLPYRSTRSNFSFSRLLLSEINTEVKLQWRDALVEVKLELGVAQVANNKLLSSCSSFNCISQYWHSEGRGERERESGLVYVTLTNLFPGLPVNIPRNEYFYRAFFSLLPAPFRPFPPIFKY